MLACWVYMRLSSGVPGTSTDCLHYLHLHHCQRSEDCGRFTRIGIIEGVTKNHAPQPIEGQAWLLIYRLHQPKTEIDVSLVAIPFIWPRVRQVSCRSRQLRVFIRALARAATFHCCYHSARNDKRMKIRRWRKGGGGRERIGLKVEGDIYCISISLVLSVWYYRGWRDERH